MENTILVLACFSVLSATSSFASTACKYECAVAKKVANGTYSLMVAPMMKDQFQAVGGYTSELNTSCNYTGRLDGQNIVANVSDRLGESTELSIEVDGASISSLSPKNTGHFQLTGLNFQVDCFR